MEKADGKSEEPRPEVFSHCLFYLHREAAKAGMEVAARIIEIAAEAVAAVTKHNGEGAATSSRKGSNGNGQRD